MTARTAGVVSRAAAGIGPVPDRVSRRISPASGGVALHYGGPPQRLTGHAGCLARWRTWWQFHTGPKPAGRAWADLAYTGGVCDHGFVFEGRGIGRRTAANGVDAGNHRYYAIVWLGGDGETPSAAALDAIDWWIDRLRRAGAGMRVVPHHAFKPTACPGPALTAFAKSRDNKPVPAPAPAPKPAPAPAPAPKPEPAPAPEPEEASVFVVTDTRIAGWQPQYLTDLITKRWIQTAAELTALQTAAAKAGRPLARISLPGDLLDRIPVVGTVPAPPKK